MTQMTAAVLHSPGHITVEQVPAPTPGEGEVLVRVAACGVCGSDIDRMMKKGAHRLPLICGHEFSGHVTELGPGVTGIEPGTLVSVPPLIPCFRCDPCVQGTFSLCEDYDYFGSRRDGAYAEYATVPLTNLLVVDQSLDPRAAAMIDPAAIALHALRRTRLGVGSRVAVVGAGPIGLFAIQWARLAGASEVLSIDLMPEKAQMALEAGATHAVSSVEAAREVAGVGYDIVFESAGAAPAVDMAVSLVARHGEATFVGIPNSTVPLQDSTFARFLRLEVDLHGAWNSFSAPFPGEEWRNTARRLADGTLKWQFMITHELPLSEVPKTMEQLADRSIFSSKVLFLPGLEE
ncbi:MAG: alcohol dehydrogenase [Marmoricola sp.]|nr:alcohol dehydrogenase [Marmoricola sp.]